MARVIVMGTPRFAVPCLLALHVHHHVVAVVTQPDRPAGRGRSLLPSPVKEKALALGLPVFQPRTLRPSEALDELARCEPEVIVVAAFGQILPASVLNLPPRGCLNVHASLLPAYRGAAPIPAAILAGDSTTGVTLMQMDEGLDTGPSVGQASLAIGPEDTTGSLTERLSRLGADLLVDLLPGWVAGALQALPQDPARATLCRPLRKEDGWLDWSRPALALDRQVRACDPWPGAHTSWQGRPLKVLRARPLPEWRGEGQPGQVRMHGKRVGVATGAGLLELVELQLSGRAPMPADALVRGQRAMIGALLGS